MRKKREKKNNAEKGAGKGGGPIEGPSGGAIPLHDPPFYYWRSHRFCVDDDANDIWIFHSAGNVRGRFSLVISDVDINRSFNQDLRDFAFPQRGCDVQRRVTVLILCEEEIERLICMIMAVRIMRMMMMMIMMMNQAFF